MKFVNWNSTKYAKSFTLLLSNRMWSPWSEYSPHKFKTLNQVTNMGCLVLDKIQESYRNQLHVNWISILNPKIFIASDRFIQTKLENETWPESNLHYSKHTLWSVWPVNRPPNTLHLNYLFHSLRMKTSALILCFAILCVVVLSQSRTAVSAAAPACNPNGLKACSGARCFCRNRRPLSVVPTSRSRSHAPVSTRRTPNMQLTSVRLILRKLQHVESRYPVLDLCLNNNSIIEIVREYDIYEIKIMHICSVLLGL